MSGDGLAERVARLEGIEAVRSLLARYCEVVDSGRLGEDFGRLFAADAVLRNPGAVEGREAIVDYYEGFLATVSFSRHHIVNQRIELEAPGRARHRAAFLAMLGRDGDSLLAFGDYDDLVELRDSGWVIVEKRNLTRGVTTLDRGWGGELSGTAPSRG